MRISELAESAGVRASAVRYYERVGLMTAPARTTGGYRDYDQVAAARLLFITRARQLGLTCEQITALVPVWAGTNCGAAHERVERLVEEKQQEIAHRVAELQEFSRELGRVQAALESEPAPRACRADLTCCVPRSEGTPVPLELAPRRTVTRA